MISVFNTNKKKVFMLFISIILLFVIDAKTFAKDNSSSTTENVVKQWELDLMKLYGLRPFMRDMPKIAPDGTAYMALNNIKANKLSIISFTLDGHINWKKDYDYYDLSQSSYRNFQLDNKGNIYYISVSDKNLTTLHCLKPDGTEKWSRSVINTRTGDKLRPEVLSQINSYSPSIRNRELKAGSERSYHFNVNNDGTVTMLSSSGLTINFVYQIDDQGNILTMKEIKSEGLSAAGIYLIGGKNDFYSQNNYIDFYDTKGNKLFDFKMNENEIAQWHFLQNKSIILVLSELKSIKNKKGEIEQIRLGTRLVGLDPKGNVLWSRKVVDSGTYVSSYLMGDRFYYHLDYRGPNIYEVDPLTGTEKTIIQSDGYHKFQILKPNVELDKSQFTQDSKWLLFESAIDAFDSHEYIINTETGQTVLLTQEPSYAMFSYKDALYFTQLGPDWKLELYKILPKGESFY
ncbi:hypothetical protein E0485_15710 [Paenibacillus albiflavus]|uniref:DUF5050 domain-containing protein n=1 Tax=Paenibacillus albiflavus TaxID=2545760 RepID=A0A4R4EA86_9BACL|nr:hypothetical protein [Paenibacillus albiflavus]TCZ75820.1 hypothetical protein E0485_15710 [Paenibacillus albiflavus]